MRLALALKAVEVMEESPVYSLLDDLLWCRKTETPILSVTGGQEEEVTTGFFPLRWRLETERKRLMKELEGLKTNVHPVDERREGSPLGKREEEANESFELERRLAFEKCIREQVAKVDHALHKFDNGTYGLCDFCGQPIDVARLEVLPQASQCLNCKAH